MYYKVKDVQEHFPQAPQIRGKIVSVNQDHVDYDGDNAEGPQYSVSIDLTTLKSGEDTGNTRWVNMRNLIPFDYLDFWEAL